MLKTPRTRFEQRLITALGYAGSLPMLLCVFLMDFPVSLDLFKAYSLAILTFLAGAWWSTALMHRTATSKQVSTVLLLSNLAVITAVIAVIFLEAAALLVLAALFAGLLMGERHFEVFLNQPKYYRHMRTGVTVIVIAFHLLGFLAVPYGAS